MRGGNETRLFVNVLAYRMQLDAHRILHCNAGIDASKQYLHVDLSGLLPQLNGQATMQISDCEKLSSFVHIPQSTLLDWTCTILVILAMTVLRRLVGLIRSPLNSKQLP